MKIADLFSKENSCRLLVNLEGRLAEKYKWYREFLVHNHNTLHIISDLERLAQAGEPFTLQGVKGRYLKLFDAVKNLVDALNNLSGGKYDALSEVCEDINDQVEPLLAPAAPRRSGALVLSLEELKPDMAGTAGSKATNLAAAGNELGLPTPPGFVITADAFWSFIEENDLNGPIDDMLAAISSAEPDQRESAAEAIQKRIRNSPVPPSLAEAISNAYDSLELKTENRVPVAVRSTAVGEDTEASFAGQYATVLNVGKKELLAAYKMVLASKYSPRAIRYRMHIGLDDGETPMCAAVIAMIDAQASGVCYSRDPSLASSPELLISATWGLGEHLVSGEVSPDTFYVDRESLGISKREIADKPHRIVPVSGGGTRLEETPETDRHLPAIDDGVVRLIAEYSLKLEDYFGSPQDVEWCVDRSGRLFILQSRPLGLTPSRRPAAPEVQEYPGHPMLLSKGNSASRGTASGRVVLPTALQNSTDFEDAILVAKTASPDYAKLAGSVKGIITDLGSVASHLASVAREFGIPMIVNAGTATTDLVPGSTITMVADATTVFEGRVDALTETSGLPNEEVLQSPAHQRLNAILAKISPLNLKDPDAPTFSPKQCKTFHDVIRYSHERIVKEMFGFSRQTAGSVKSVKMTSSVPVALYFVDLGGGLKENLTTCDDITPEAIACRPMKVLWRGLSYPGVDWSGAIGVNTRNMMALMTSGPPPQMASYAIVSSEYVNLSIKFGYHYATLDILWSDNAEDNYISLQFGGGAGSIHGRSMRIHFLSEVLEQLGFMLQVSGDVLDATVKGYDSPAMEETLDQLGRLLACSRLLDLAIPSQERVASMKASFFSGDYNFLQQSEDPLPNFYTPIGEWSRVVEDGVTRCLQDGSKSGDAFSCSLKNMMGKMVGPRYQQFLDNIKAYHYFPLAILKDSHVSDALIQVAVTPESGCLDNTGGLIFGMKNISNFFVLSIDALDNSVSLFEFVNGKREKRAVVEKKIRPGTKYIVSADIQGASLNGFLDEEKVLEFDAEASLEGYVGLWSKADSKVFFDHMTIQEGGAKHVVPF